METISMYTNFGLLKPINYRAEESLSMSTTMTAAVQHWEFSTIKRQPKDLAEKCGLIIDNWV